MKTWTTRGGLTITKVLGGRSNVFLVACGDKNILVDTSPGTFRKKLDSRLKSLSLHELDYLLITHTHYDHAENAAWLQRAYHARVIVHKNEAEDLISGGNWDVEGTNGFSRLLVKILRRLLPGKLSFEPCQPDLTVDEKMDLTPYGCKAYILHTPGHTRGSMSLVVDDEIALVGDCMFGVFRGSAFPPFGSDVNQMIDSWGTLLDTGCRLFLPSHGSANSRKLVQADYRKRKRGH